MLFEATEIWGSLLHGNWHPDKKVKTTNVRGALVPPSMVKTSVFASPVGAWR